MAQAEAGDPPIIRVGLVDDHALFVAEFGEMVGAVSDLELSATASTVAELIAPGLVAPDLVQGPLAPGPIGPGHVAPGVALDVVVLDLVLVDGSSVSDNVTALCRAGARVLVITGGENTAAIRAAARAGAVGMLRKSEPAEVLVTALRDAAADRTVASTEWAAALDSDDALEEVGLTDRERQVLALVAAGHTASAVAHRVGIFDQAVLVHIDRVRAKYRRVGADGSGAPRVDGAAASS